MALEGQWVGKVLSDLAVTKPVDARHERSIAAFRVAVSKLERPFDREAGGSHITSSAIVVGARGVLLHKHRLIGIWMQPGGHVEPGEPPWDGAMRETWEETGIRCEHPPNGPTLIHLDVHKGPRCAQHLDLRYLLFAPDQDPAPGAGESQDVEWMSLAAASDVADEGLLGALVAARGVIRSATGQT